MNTFDIIGGSSCESSGDTAIQRWNTPHPLFGSGNDSRSSENGMLQLFYGSMEKAAQFSWMNGGRTLIDKTYIHILWTAESLAPTGRSFDEMASRTDNFIRTELAPIWGKLNQLEHEQRHFHAIDLVGKAANGLFGSDLNDPAASLLLFYLCPQLPIFPYRSTRQQLVQKCCPNIAISDYPSYHNACRSIMAKNLPRIYAQPPQCPSPSNEEYQTVYQQLSQSDWWPRRVLMQQLQDQTTALTAVA
mgnify:CR=1 FL=1